MLQSQRNSTRLSAKFLHDRGQECTLSAHGEDALCKLMQEDAKNICGTHDEKGELGENAKTIYALMADKRPRTTADIAHRVGMGPKEAAGSIQALCQKELLERDWIDGISFYTLPKKKRKAQTATQDKILQQMQPGVFYVVSNISELTGISRRIVSQALKRAMKAGKVERRPLARNPKHYEWRKL